jgi:hypothetical protein
LKEAKDAWLTASMKLFLRPTQKLPRKLEEAGVELK